MEPSDAAVVTGSASEAPAEPTGTAAVYTADGVDAFVVEELTGDVLIELLVQTGVLREGVVLNSCELTEDRIVLDFNSAFGEQLNSSGSTGELILVNCLVNTFIRNFGLSSVSFTVDGEIFESGHVIYDFPLTFTTE